MSNIPNYVIGCNKCGSALDISKHRLFGGLYVQLCLACANDWGDFSESTPEWAEYAETIEPTIQILCEQTRGDGHDRREEILSLVRRRSELSAHFRKLSKDWLAGLVGDVQSTQPTGERRGG